MFVFCFLGSCLLSYQTDGEIFATKSSEETVEFMCEMIDHAQSSIEISACYFAGKVALRLLEHLYQALFSKKELTVKLLYSPVLFHSEEEKQQIAKMQQQFDPRFEVIESSAVLKFKPDCALLENHCKYALIDQLYFTFGGTNLADCMCTEGLTPSVRKSGKTLLEKKMHSACRDQDLVGKSFNLASQLRSHFYHLREVWLSYDRTGEFDPCFNHYTVCVPEVKKQGSCPKFDSDTRRICLDPKDLTLLYSEPLQFNPITEALEKQVLLSSKQIFLGNLYFQPESNLLSMLANAASRGVRITLITNGVYPKISPASTPQFAWGGRLNYFPLLYGKHYNLWQRHKVDLSSACLNVEIYEYYVQDTLYHKKVAIFDHCVTYLGSYNLGKKSHAFDFEIILKITSPLFAKQIVDNLEIDRLHSQKVNAQDVVKWYFNPLITIPHQLEKKFTEALF